MASIDLLIHTTESDGTDTPEELLKKAGQLEINLLSITDHNVISSYAELAGKRALEEF
jgi:predicted metal-dependent phosphoesterase TrpH